MEHFSNENDDYLIDSGSIEMADSTLKELLDYLSDEIIIFNREQQVIYANKKSESNYGLLREDLIGKYSHELIENKYWSPSIYPKIYDTKEPASMIQTTNTGAELLTSAIPILDEDNEVELLITTARELKNYQLYTLKPHEKTQTLEEYGIITLSKNMKKVIKFSQKVAKTSSTILIQGDSGTGKGVLAKYIHQISERKDQPFLTINCATIPDDLLESELFGYKKGAFTGSNPAGKSGLLESADGGTVFLDEIGEISFSLQAKLLQVIQDKEFIPIGSLEKKQVNVRFIVATNRDLEAMIKAGQFREDLYYRLNVIDILLPPLSERKEDIIPLVYHFLNKFNEKYESSKLISQKCLDVLAVYPWPGNIRQLENLIEKLVIVSDSVIDIKDLPDMFIKENAAHMLEVDHLSLDEAVEQTRRNIIRRAYRKHKSSRKVAAHLNISQTTATRLIREHCKDIRNN